MAELKKTPFNSINEDIISMEFNKNPNIPTANYSAETADRIQEAIIKKMRTEKLKKMIENELKTDQGKVRDGESIGIGFNFSSM